MKHIIIYGSSGHEDGVTWQSVKALQRITDAYIVNLSQHNVSYYDYSHNNRNDDFKDIVENLLNYDHITFATPVYWYTMSAQLKTFFDRLTDLMTIRKPWGRALKNKSTSLIATGYQEALPEGFTVPFQLTSDYFDMHYKGHLYINSEMRQKLNSPEGTQWFQNFIQTITT